MEEKIVLFLLMIESDVTVGGAWHFNVQFSLQLSVSGDTWTWHGWSPSTRPSTLTRSRQLKLKVSMKRVGLVGWWRKFRHRFEVRPCQSPCRDDSPVSPRWLIDDKIWVSGAACHGRAHHDDVTQDRPLISVLSHRLSVSSVSSTCHVSTVVSLLKCC